jgi:CheY-like chemotaxis protein
MNLGGHLGTELLRWLRGQPKLADIPFVFLSGSYIAPDKLRARELGADGFYRKTGDIEEATEHAAQILRLVAVGHASHPRLE